MGIEVIKPGLATTVQDSGRIGYYSVGIPISGALEERPQRAAHRWFIVYQQDSRHKALFDNWLR